MLLPVVDVDKLTLDSDSPLMPDENGKYPIPYPGIIKDRGTHSTDIPKRFATA